jgi:competence protein ComEC
VEATAAGKRAAAHAAPSRTAIGWGSRWTADLGATFAPRRWLIWAPVALGLGVHAYFAAPSEPAAALLVTTATLAAAAALIALVAARRAWTVAAGLCLAAALVAAGFSLAGAKARAVAAPTLAGETVALLEGRVRAISQSASGRPRLTLDRVRVWGLDAARTPAQARVAFGAVEDAAGIAPGDRISVMARLSPPAGPAEPGGFDFARAAWFDRLGAVGVAQGRVAHLGAAPPDGALDRFAVWRARLRARLAEGLRAAMPGEAGAVAAALAAGDRAALSPQTTQALRDSGLAHLLAISGLHMAMVCGLTFVAVRRVLTLVPVWGLRWRVKALAAGAALVAGALYLGLSGGSASTQRAFAMAAVALTAVLVARPAVTLRALAAAALAMLALTPQSLTQAGFQMSFAATLALVAAYDAARRRGWLIHGGGLRARAARYAVGLAVSSLIAGLATAPFAAFHFNRIAGYGLAANLAALPAMGAAAAPGLLLAGLAAPFGLEAWPLRLAQAGIEWILAVAETVAAWPGAASTVAAPHPAALTCVAAGGLLLCLGVGRVRALAAAPLALAAALWIAAPQARPALLIAPFGDAIGLALADGRAVDINRAGWFAAQNWLRRDGGAPERAFARDGAWRVASGADGARVFVHRGATATPGARCRAGAILVLPNSPAPASPGPCVVLDRTALSDARARAYRFENGWRLEAIAGGGRPWSRTAPALR